MGAAYWDFGLLFVVHAELVGGLEPGDHLADVIDVDYESAMGAPEEGGVEQVEELFQSAEFGESFEGLGGDADDAFVDVRVADFTLIDEQQTALGLHD